MRVSRHWSSTKALALSLDCVPLYNEAMLRVMGFCLQPNPAQTSRLFHILGTGRKLYNHALDQRIQFYKSTGKTLGKYDQTADLTQLRAVSQVLADVPVQIERDSLDRLDKAFKAFFRRCKAGEAKVGFPRFKGANRWNSFGISAPGKVMRVGNRIYVAGVDEPIKARNVREVNGKIKQLIVVHRAGKWHARLVIDDGQEPPAKAPIVSSVGIDVGLKSFATFSTGEHIDNPRFGRKMAGKLRRAQQAVSRKKKGSRNRRKAIRRLQRVHAKIADARWNFTHHLSKRIVDEHQLVAVEKLNIKGMARGRLAMPILDAAWGQFLFQLAYKAESAGCQLVEVNPRGTSQECSRCGDLVLKDLSVRTHVCHCGLVLDRDENAAKNILRRAETTLGIRGNNASGVAIGRPRKRKS